jgi:hypothetical protein
MRGNGSRMLQPASEGLMRWAAVVSLQAWRVAVAESQLGACIVGRRVVDFAAGLLPCPQVYVLGVGCIPLHAPHLLLCDC